MMIMTKEEARSAARIWAANVKSPIDRDTQIMLMTTARQRHEGTLNKIARQLEMEREGK